MEKRDIPGNALDTFLCLWLHGSTWDGNVPSKAGRDWLVDQKLAARGDGWQWLTEAGGRLAIEFGWGAKKDEWESKQRKARQEASDNKARYTWAANELLACDYGDNEAPGEQIGWRVYGWRDRSGEHRIYGPSIDAAIDAAIAGQPAVSGGSES